ncbi:rhamnan synthesis F family protein [Streptococcus zalophi]|uniref:Alpha-L-Rha alpha-1,3-L-rhamnosyltransferase n=1 Tax=Streptococcus zalophi TaxID=640031 RepID=A0A934P8J9_9STRE|nr:rhamnan synthesis F family protein [Streptococcus zalophi]MBJ8349048.1 alpha-L-Rha alpha-1,3-L-rhamnosyltransferase [Streptococcus zalophi]MCR8967801.1 rhamnan synthesis F family protein [Streptococcus zalophi]
MNRLLLYVHFNKNNKLSPHVIYQLEKMKPLFSKIVFITNSSLKEQDKTILQSKGLFNEFIQRENKGYDFAAWRDGMERIGMDHLSDYDSLTVMNDTCFGPLWDMESYYNFYEENDMIDFWGMTNHKAVKTREVSIDEHLQSYFISFKKRLMESKVFKSFWNNIESYTDVQKVIDNYETQYTKLLTKAGFNYASVLNTVPLADDFYHSNFTIHYPHVLLQHKVPFIKIKTFDLTQHLSPYVLQEIEKISDYPIDLVLSHMSDISLPTPAYLLDRKVLKDIVKPYSNTKKVAIHLHTYYVDLLETFLTQFEIFNFNYDLFLTTDSNAKKETIEKILKEKEIIATVLVTGNRGRDILPMLKLKTTLAHYDYIGHFHTKKSPEYPYWVGDSWREELFQMMLKPAEKILSTFENNENCGLIISDIPTFFRYTKIVDPWNENKFASDMNDLWERMNLGRSIDFDKLNNFIMSYGTFIWFKYDALKPLFDLDIKDDEIPKEPLPQHTILHSIERILMYLSWARGYDYRISRNDIYITPFVDNTVLNIRPDTLPNTYVNFDNIGGIKGAFKYIFLGPASAIKYIIKRFIKKVKS